VKIALPAVPLYLGVMHNDAPPSPQAGHERLLVLLTYGLFLIAPAGGLWALLGVIIAHVRLAHARGTLFESHYRNLIRVFWTVLIFALVMMFAFTFGMGFSLFTLVWPFSPGWPFWPGAMVGAGWAMLLPLTGLVSLLMVAWYYWRLLRGFLRALDDKSY
jgi:uncharacterized membrane protein